jgi:hypothetical protein
MLLEFEGMRLGRSLARCGHLVCMERNVSSGEAVAFEQQKSTSGRAEDHY